MKKINKLIKRRFLDFTATGAEGKYIGDLLTETAITFAYCAVPNY